MTEPALCDFKYRTKTERGDRVVPCVLGADHEGRHVVALITPRALWYYDLVPLPEPGRFQGIALLHADLKPGPKLTLLEVAAVWAYQQATVRAMAIVKHERHRLVRTLDAVKQIREERECPACRELYDGGTCGFMADDDDVCRFECQACGHAWATHHGEPVAP